VTDWNGWPNSGQAMCRVGFRDHVSRRGRIEDVPSPFPGESDPDRVPDLLRKPAATPPPGPGPHVGPDVGEFRQGSPWSQWALSRYLVGRAITESVGSALTVVTVVLIGLAVVGGWLLGSVVLAVLLAIIAVFVLLLRWLLVAAVRRLTAFGQFQPVVEQRMNALVRDTRGDVLRELRRIGLPGRVWTLPLLPMFFVGPSRRARTVERLRAFDISRVVPKSRLDETFLLLRQAYGGEGPGRGR
jgi:hypothetical protein